MVFICFMFKKPGNFDPFKHKLLTRVHFCPFVCTNQRTKGLFFSWISCQDIHVFDILVTMWQFGINVLSKNFTIFYNKEFHFLATKIQEARHLDFWNPCQSISFCQLNSWNMKFWNYGTKKPPISMKSMVVRCDMNWNPLAYTSMVAFAVHLN